MERKRRLALIVAGAIVIGGLAFAVQSRGDDPTRLDDAAGTMGDRDRFTSGRKAATTVAEVSRELLESGRVCRAEGGPAEECELRLRGAAYTQVLAVKLYYCPPGRVEQARLDTVKFLQDLDDWRSGSELPEPPPLPSC